MADRFDSLFEGMSEDQAIENLSNAAVLLKNPGHKYLAATRLGACSSERSLQILLKVADTIEDNLYEIIARRKAIDALGRRKSSQAIPILFKAILDRDEPTVVNAADAITKISPLINDLQYEKLLVALNGPDNQKRAIIQLFTRLGLTDNRQFISAQLANPNLLVSGAARAYLCKIKKCKESLNILIEQLKDKNAGIRRSAVIDLGDTDDQECLDELSICPVSMPLRAKSAFKLLSANGIENISTFQIKLLRKLLIDDPRELWISAEWEVTPNKKAILTQMQHRDEAKQYAAAQALLSLPDDMQSELIDELKTDHGTDYGIHYLLTVCIGLSRKLDGSQWIATALNEEAPQYAKSRIAAAWGCQNLGLKNQIDMIKKIAETSEWQPLSWSCRQVYKSLS